MQTRNRNTFITIHTEGALLPVDLLQRIHSNDAALEGLTPESYHLAPGEKLNAAIEHSWSRLNSLWGAFKTACERLGEGDLGTTLTRERWLLPLFQELGFGRLSTSKAVEIEGKSYPISHRWHTANTAVPLHLVGCGIELDKRTPGAAGASRSSPHSLMQEYLNRSDDVQWGVISNGLGLRILRDNATLTRQAYIEFDLESIFEGQVYSDFVILWMICHQSRFENSDQQAECILECWSKSAQESGTRALDDLRRGVEEAIVSLGQGFLRHPLNVDLRTQLKKGDLLAQDYYRQLLRLVYRLIFLFAAEDRDLLLLPGAALEARQRFQRYYSTTHLRVLAERQRGSRHHDRYEALRLVMTLLGSDTGCPELAIPALGGFLFDAHSTKDLNDARLDNQALLMTVRSLAFITAGNTDRAVDYRNLGPEELGSVYESLLELHPLLNTDAGTFELSSAAGNERKTTGSYYTPSSLIQVLLDSALVPVIENALNVTRESKEENRQNESRITLLESRLLALKVCDPACGSGHFLIAAAHCIAGRLAEVRAGGNEPSPIETRRALRDVIRHCIYGVDINPMAVELCKVNLWLESLEPGKPLSFLDAHIKCGNSLVGVGPNQAIDDLEIPVEAFNPVSGDDKKAASLLKKVKKDRPAHQPGFLVTLLENQVDLQNYLASLPGQLDQLPEDTAQDVEQKAEQYQQWLTSEGYQRRKLMANLWVAAFFWTIRPDNNPVLSPVQSNFRKLQEENRIPQELAHRVNILAQEHNFLHWELAFPQVFTGGDSGFDCVLGNPPWERIKLQEEEFFAQRDPEIATAPNKAARETLIKKLNETNPALALAFNDAKHAAECTSKFARTSQRFPLTAVGDVNTYALFAEHFRGLMNARGRAGVIVPTGIATDDTTKDFFGSLVEKRALASLFDFENKEAIFPGVHLSYKFCLLTLSGAPVKQAQFAFFATRVEHLRDERRRFTLDPAEIAMFNPNTRTMPVFRTRADAELTLKIYQHFKILVNEQTRENLWDVLFVRSFDSYNDAKLFKERNTLENEGFVLSGNSFIKSNAPKYFPLYEAKMIQLYDHRAANVIVNLSNRVRQNQPEQVSEEQHADRNFYPMPNNWVAENEVKLLVGDDLDWFLGFKKVTSPTNERTFIATVLPLVGCTYSFNALKWKRNFFSCGLIANLNSLIFDYVARQKLGGVNLAQFIVNQLPVLQPTVYTTADMDFITPRVLELVYTAYDLRPFAEDMEYHGEPFRWNEERRAFLRAELDAYYAKLYGLTRDELRYILDPQDVYGPDFPGETFRVLKDKEMRQFGEYRTRRLVLEAWDQLFGSESGLYRTEKSVIRPPRKVDPKSTYASDYTLEPNPWQGGQAEVFIATHRLTGQRVALKRLQHRNDKNALSRLKREITSLLSINDFHVMPIISHARDFSWYIMPLACQTLCDHPIPVDEIELLGIITAIANGLKSGHRQGDIHRDVTPRNIFLINESPLELRWVIGDWGLVRQQGLTATMQTQAMGSFGTLGFAPPEQWDDPHNAKVTVDVFSLGRVIAWALTGKLPAPNIPLIPTQPGWNDLVRDMTEMDPTKRLADMDAVLKRLNDLQSRYPIIDKIVPEASQSPLQVLSRRLPTPYEDQIMPPSKLIETASDVQPTLSDFGLYKCEACGKLVMGYEKESHQQEIHNGKSVEWKKVI